MLAHGGCTFGPQVADAAVFHQQRDVTLLMGAAAVESRRVCQGETHI